MRISILQTDIVWENKQENLRRLREKLETLRGTTEIVVLPETFSTGFSMDTASLAEPTTGETIATLRQWSEEYRLALAGSYIACETASEGGKPSYYNRAFFLTPEGNAYYYDKRHLFRMGHETEHFTPGNRRPIIRYRGWNILLLVCYDLRFPVWSRNTSNEYDLLITSPTGPFPAGKSGTSCCKRARWKTSVMSAVSTVSARTAETFHTAEAVWSTLRRGKCLPLCPTTKRRLPPPPSTFPPCRSSG